MRVLFRTSLVVVAAVSLSVVLTARVNLTVEVHMVTRVKARGEAGGFVGPMLGG
jgi:hypothetical protein